MISAIKNKKYPNITQKDTMRMGSKRERSLDRTVAIPRKEKSRYISILSRIYPEIRKRNITASIIKSPDPTENIKLLRKFVFLLSFSILSRSNTRVYHHFLYVSRNICSSAGSRMYQTIL
jgi:hypothetical protein